MMPANTAQKLRELRESVQKDMLDSEPALKEVEDRIAMMEELGIGVEVLRDKLAWIRKARATILKPRG